ncbi:MAG: zinc ribbon domain-containing protein [Desulfobacterales bacterium]
MIPIFLVGGISPKTKRLDNNPRLCPACGLAQAYYTRIDHYLNLFFIPLLRVKKGEPFLYCERCARSRPEFKAASPSGFPDQKLTCSNCAKPLNNAFMYCPYCGTRV